MNKGLFIIGLFILISMVQSIAHDISEEKVQLLRTGTFHGNEVSAESGELWFGLYPLDNGYEIKSSIITVELVHDGCVDEKDEKSGKKVTVNLPGNPVFLFKGLINVYDGKVQTVFSGKKFMYPGEHWTQMFPGDDYFGFQAFGLAVMDVRRSEFYAILQSYELKMSKKPWRRIQTIASFNVIDMDGRPEFHWIGDLDGDSKPDVFMNLTDTYAGDYWTLFLSSLAKDGEYLHKAAIFIQGSC